MIISTTLRWSIQLWDLKLKSLLKIKTLWLIKRISIEQHWVCILPSIHCKISSVGEHFAWFRTCENVSFTLTHYFTLLFVFVNCHIILASWFLIFPMFRTGLFGVFGADLDLLLSTMLDHLLMRCFLLCILVILDADLLCSCCLGCRMLLSLLGYLVDFIIHLLWGCFLFWGVLLNMIEYLV